MPGLGTVGAFESQPLSSEAFFSFSSYVQAPAVFRIQEHEVEPTVWEAVDSPVDSDAFEVRQVFFPSKDGTRIPMYLIGQHGLPADGTVPGLLYGYGGFNIALTPSYSTWIFPWIEAGNLLAIANLRGGSEYGEDWHRAGMLGNKQNVFDDFVAAGEYLKAEGLVDPDRLAIHGRSNGGLLVGAALTQRPELWRSVVCGVPLLDMLRYDKFRMAKLWVSEYGSAENPEDFALAPCVFPVSPDRARHGLSGHPHLHGGLRFTRGPDARAEDGRAVAGGDVRRCADPLAIRAIGGSREGETASQDCRRVGGYLELRLCPGPVKGPNRTVIR